MLYFIVSCYTATTKDNASASISCSRFDSVLLFDFFFFFLAHTYLYTYYIGTYNNDIHIYIYPYYCIIDTYLAPRSTIGGGGNSTIASGFRPKNRLLQRENGHTRGQIRYLSNDIYSFSLSIHLSVYLDVPIFNYTVASISVNVYNNIIQTRTHIV